MSGVPAVANVYGRASRRRRGGDIGVDTEEWEALVLGEDGWTQWFVKAHDRTDLEGVELKSYWDDGFHLLNHTQFVEKVHNVVGLYLNRPEAAVVYCVDKKSQSRPWLAHNGRA